MKHHTESGCVVYRELLELFQLTNLMLFFKIVDNTSIFNGY
jgi:hypothetical protein